MSTNCKFYKEEEYRSIDGGITWTATGVYRKGDLIEYDSPDCSYVPPTPTFDGKFKAEYSDGTSYSAECDSYSGLDTDDTQPSGYQVSAMTSATIGNCVTGIYFAFSGCTNLSSIDIPSGVTEIGDSAFDDCRSLTSVTIPDNVTSIGWSAFRNCSGLTSIDIPTGVTTIKQGAFSHCYGLTSIDIPSGVTRIENVTFHSCSGITNTITIPNSVTSIGNSAFAYCKNIPNIVIGSGVSSIGQTAFECCNNLTSITINATTPPTLGSNVFYNTNDCPIYVPCESVDAFKSAWSSYADRIQCIPTFNLISYIYYRDYIHGTLTGTISGTNGFSASFEHSSESATQTLVSNIVGTTQFVGYVMDSSYDTTNPYQAITKTVVYTRIQEGIIYTIRLNVGKGLKGYLKIEKN